MFMLDYLHKENLKCNIHTVTGDSSTNIGEGVLKTNEILEFPTKKLHGNCMLIK